LRLGISFDFIQIKTGMNEIIWEAAYTYEPGFGLLAPPLFRMLKALIPK
jgi:hypothetical protein